VTSWALIGRFGNFVSVLTRTDDDGRATKLSGRIIARCLVEDDNVSPRLNDPSKVRSLSVLPTLMTSTPLIPAILKLPLIVKSGAGPPDRPAARRFTTACLDRLALVGRTVPSAADVILAESAAKVWLPIL
jgi:hypothetical protein